MTKIDVRTEEPEPIDPKVEQEGMSKKEVLELLESKKDELDPTKPKYDHIIDLDSMKRQNHILVDRGAKYTCEGAGHPSHDVWKRR